jgi:hypothetical protein
MMKIIIIFKEFFANTSYKYVILLIVNVTV